MLERDRSRVEINGEVKFGVKVSLKNVSFADILKR